MNELKERLKDEINNGYNYFNNQQHFEEIDKSVGHDEDAMRIYDVGYIKALEMVVRDLEELTVEDYD